MNRRPGQPPRAQLPPMSAGEKAFVALCVLVGLTVAAVTVWAIATGRAPWWLVLIS